jgi:amino acid permease
LQRIFSATTKLSMDAKVTSVYGQFAKGRTAAREKLEPAEDDMENAIAPSMTAGRELADREKSHGLRRSVGFYGLTFVSLGSIIGSGWLLGALNAAKVAGPASIISWILAACMLALLALTYAELGATLSSRGWSSTFPVLFARPIAGFTAGGPPGCRPCSSRPSKYSR